MANELMAIDNLQVMAKAVAASRLWKTVDTPEKALALMLLCQSEGLHPMTAVRRYDLIQGTPTMKSEAQLAEFYKRGGSVVWMQRTAEVCEAKFSHPKSCPDGVVIKWTIEDAKKAGLLGKDNWRNYPRQMLSARVQAEGVQVVDPGAGLGMMISEEAMDVQSMVSDQAAALSSDLTGEAQEEGIQESGPQTPAMNDVESRKVRAELTKSLQECHTPIEFRGACKVFQDKYGKGIWPRLTAHNREETFHSLAKVHQDRINGEEHFVSPEGQAEWREKVLACKTESEFRQYQETILAYTEYRENQENHDAISAKGRELGIEEYAID